MGPLEARRDLLSDASKAARAARRLAPALALAALLAGCAGGGPARDADRSYTSGVARVDRVELELVSTRPPRLRVGIEGVLADSCTEIEPPEIRPLGARIEISFETRRPAGASCPARPERFRRSIPLMLGGGFRFYVVEVNGVVESIALPPERDLLP